LSLNFDSGLKNIELARTLKPDDAMRVRANDVKVCPGTFCFEKKCCVCASCFSSHYHSQGAEFWAALESVFRPFEGRDLEFLRTSATLDEDSAMRVLFDHFAACLVCPVAH
jgi:hypothetical protein